MTSHILGEAREREIKYAYMSMLVIAPYDDNDISL